MKNQIVYILPGIFLLINAWYDIRKRKILLHSIWTVSYTHLRAHET